MPSVFATAPENVGEGPATEEVDKLRVDKAEEVVPTDV